MRRPWLPIALALILGILISSRNAAHLPISFIISFSFAVICLIFTFLGWNKSAFLSALIAFSFAGSILITKHHNPDLSNHISTLEKQGVIDLNVPVDLQGIINSHPERKRKNILINLTLESIHRNKTVIPAEGMLRITIHLSEGWQQSDLPFRYGDRIRLFTKLREPTAYRNPGNFDYRLFLRNQGITHTGTVNSPLSVEIVSRGHGFPLGSQFSSLKTHMEKSIRHYFSDSAGVNEKGALLEAMLLGNRGYIDEEILYPLRNAGLIHIIAISGYHVWVISLLAFGMFRLFNLDNRWASVMTAAVVIGYWALSGGRNSTSRACIIAIIFLLGKLFYRRADSLNNLAFSAFIILLFRPVDLYGAGFQLTFTAALFIGLIYKNILPYFERIRMLGPPIAVGLAAQAGVVPLVAWHFNMVNLHSSISGLVVLPFASAALLFGFIFITVGQFIPIISDILSALISFSLGLLLEMAELINQMIPLTLRVLSPNVWLIVLYYALVLAWHFWHSKQLDRIGGKVFVPTAFSFVPVVLLLLFVLFNPFVQSPGGIYAMHKIDVGTGSSTLFELPDKSSILIDGGGTPISDFDIGEYVVSPFLWHRGHREIDLIIATHSDADHMEGLISVLRNFHVPELWLPQHARNNSILKELLQLAKQKNAIVKRFKRGDSANWKSTQWEFFNPPLKPYRGQDSSNHNSMICRVSFEGYSAVFCGDAEQRALDDVVNEYGDKVNSTILEVPHHGSSDALSRAFLRSVKPEIALISAGRNNHFGFPRQVVLDALTDENTRIFRTDQKGLITLRFLAKQIEVLSGREHVLQAIINKK